MNTDISYWDLTVRDLGQSIGWKLAKVRIRTKEPG